MAAQRDSFTQVVETAFSFGYSAAVFGCVDLRSLMEGESAAKSEEVPPLPALSKADPVHRSIAKALDFLIVATLYQIPLPVAPLGGLAYLLLADGFREGRSVGKWLMRLQIIPFDDFPSHRNQPKGPPPLFRESILRNIPFAVAYLLLWIPLIGKVLGGISMVAVVGLEWLLVLGNQGGLRFGDQWAKTQVINTLAST
jgi:uncharacterized RDD family membrane protein YckC